MAQLDDFDQRARDVIEHIERESCAMPIDVYFIQRVLTKESSHVINVLNDKIGQMAERQLSKTEKINRISQRILQALCRRQVRSMTTLYQPVLPVGLHPIYNLITPEPKILLLKGTSVAILATCSICLNDKPLTITISKCKHSFCKDCIFQSIAYNKTCPMCRNPIKMIMQSSNPLITETT